MPSSGISNLDHRRPVASRNLPTFDFLLLPIGAAFQPGSGTTVNLCEKKKADDKEELEFCFQTGPRVLFFFM